MARKSYRVRFQGGVGFTLAGIVDRPDDQIDAPVAVFSHCFTCNKDLKAIVRISRALADHGIAVLRYDMTGLGGSDGKFSETNFSTNLADLKSAVHYANAQIGPVTSLIGHSFGGAVSLAFAGQPLESENDDHANLKALITLAAPSDTTHLATLLTRFDPNIELTGSGQVTIGGTDWDIDQQMLDDFRRHDLPHMITQIKAATLLFHSPSDATVSFDHALRIIGLIQNSPVNDKLPSLISLHNADHLLVDPPENIQFVADTTAAFLQRYARPGSN